ncbi:carbonic anhydrase 1-like [Dermacentor silvarum]|uniref:carbonic anhydrase 1-like n=1 Tax=Dermacentor silvarum TaxID=543639 RepID=UPI0021008505|nr:carbonic anhydrase 1-like [Dermacentor silvarum]
MTAQILRRSSTTTTTLQGRWQSPVGLCTPGRGERVERARADLNMHGYHVPFTKYEVKDTNIGLRVRPLGAIQPRVTGSGLPGRFLLHNLHFHVGLDDTCGSEHTIDGEKFAMEAHFVHYSDRFRSFKRAATERDGLVVISVLFKLSDDKSPESLQAIISAMESPERRKVRLNICSAITLNTFNFEAPLILSQMLPGVPPTSYFLYPGSLTTPPWSENVTWVVCTQTLEVTPASLARFRKNAAVRCKGNIRPIQPLGGRQVILCT